MTVQPIIGRDTDLVTGPGHLALKKDNPNRMDSQGFVARGRDKTSQMIKRHGAFTRKLSLAVVDQAVFAGSNFLINLLLARWLFPEQYGAFVLAYSWFLLAQNIYDAIIIEPMVVNGAGKYADRLRSYFGFVFRHQIWVSLVFAVFLFLGGLAAHVFDSELVGAAVIATALMSPLLITRWLTRQPFYILAQPRNAVIGGILYLVLSLAGIAVLHTFPVIEQVPFGFTTLEQVRQGGFWWADATILNPVTTTLVMGAASLIAAVIVTVFFIKPDFNLKASTLNTREIVSAHWAYGRWASVERILAWIPSNIYYIVLPAIAGLAVSGGLRALSNLTMPVYMAMTSMYAIIFPSFVRTYTHGGLDALTKRVRVTIILMMTMTGIYCLILTLFGTQISNLLFAGKYDYLTTTAVMFTLGLGPVISAFTGAIDAALRAMGLVKYTFVAKVLPTALTMTVGLFLAAQFGILGANIGFIVTSLVHTGVLFLIVRRTRRNEQNTGAQTEG
jgi:O-antigen/teichoic acid export membrane protein